MSCCHLKSWCQKGLRMMQLIRGWSRGRCSFFLQLGFAKKKLFCQHNTIPDRNMVQFARIHKFAFFQNVFDFLTFDKHSYICLDICMYLCICNIYVYLCKYIHTSTYFLTVEHVTIQTEPQGDWENWETNTTKKQFIYMFFSSSSYLPEN